MKIILNIILLVSFVSLSALSLEEAKQIALQNSPELLAAEQSKKASKTNLWSSYLSIAPSATISGSYTYFDETQNNFGSDYDASINYSLIVNQPIFNGGKVWLGASISKDAHKMSQQSFQNSYLQTIVDVKTKYFAVLKNRDLLKIAKLNLQNSQTNVKIAQAKYEAGSISKSELLQLQAEQATKEVNLLQMQMLYENSLLDLMNFLQMDDVDEIEEVAKTDYESELEILKDQDMNDLENLVQKILQKGLESNPTLNIARIGVNTNRKSMWVSGGNFLPSLNLQYLKRWDKYDFENDLNENSGQLSLNFSVPIFPLVDNGLDVATSRYQLKQSIFELKSLENSMELAIKSSVLNLVASAKTLHSTDISLEYSRQTYEQMKERFSNGQISANELLSAEIMYNSAQNQAAQSFYDYLTAKATLLQQMGTDNEEVLNKFIENI
ncbi:MAG: TolC family protein [Candidatus Cloacimonetes bacterium]|nr:TolC family protein [Candidatus Cloacimonadota bacterium]MCF7813595.1 TolC family protein [Candidatus Cloacimonadota bacterium]MCF7867911.1 TolC family protein [Candidatus Cloacimonadota bacterium]MCF7882896.1 TolC family protein [Candidatus Cloacimonadota bacterium]